MNTPEKENKDNSYEGMLQIGVDFMVHLQNTLGLKDAPTSKIEIVLDPNAPVPVIRHSYWLMDSQPLKVVLDEYEFVKKKSNE